MTRLFKTYHQLFSVLDLVFPPQCAGCDKAGVRWCSDCVSDTHIISSKICSHCGMPNQNANKCVSCQKNPLMITAARSWALHKGPVRKAVHRLKYRRDIALGEVFSKHLLEIIPINSWKIDLILPVPLAKKRQRQRGYNQAGLLAYPLAWVMGLEYSNRTLIRKRETRTQIGLNIQERRENVRNAFFAKSKLVKGKRILIVDDVFTTGATLNSAAEALLEAGAKNVFAVTLARATILSQY